MNIQPTNIPPITFSIVTSWFNVEKMKFDWRGALENWINFQKGNGQIVIAINVSVDDCSSIIKKWVENWKLENPTNNTKIEIFDIDIPYSDPAFDGKGKAAATEKATEPYVILLDCDERLFPFSKHAWSKAAIQLETSSYEGFLVPVVDLIFDEKHYKSIGTKWYLHKNLPYITRGVVGWAYREDGSIDKTKSDTCEAINKDTKDLINSVPLLMPSLPDWMKVGILESGDVPFVYHLGFLDAEQRVRQSEFWRPVWNLRDKQSEEPEVSLETINEIKKYRHNLPTWKPIS